MTCDVTTNNLTETVNETRADEISVKKCLRARYSRTKCPYSVHLYVYNVTNIALHMTVCENPKHNDNINIDLSTA